MIQLPTDGLSGSEFRDLERPKIRRKTFGRSRLLLSVVLADVGQQRSRLSIDRPVDIRFQLSRQSGCRICALHKSNWR